MTETTVSELARALAELADIVTAVRPDAHRVAARARELSRPLRSGDPARWAVAEQTVTVEIDVPALVVAETLANEGTGAVVVVASRGPVGIVAERDIVSAVASGKDLAELDAGDLVAADLVTAESSDTISQVAALMTRHHVRHVPLIVAGRITGVVSALDLLGALAVR